MMDYDFSLKACKESVQFEVEELGANPFEELGRAIIRAEHDIFFNKTMITAWKEYIEENGMKWNER